jgi:hypothetical protein
MRFVVTCYQGDIDGPSSMDEEEKERYREGCLEEVFADSSESSEELLIVAAGKKA